VNLVAMLLEIDFEILKMVAVRSSETSVS